MNGCGMYAWFGFILPFEDSLKRISEAGFDSICTWFADKSFDGDLDRRNHAEAAAKYNLRIEHSHLPYEGAQNIWFDNIDGISTYEKYIEDIKIAASCGIDTLVIHPIDRIKPQISPDLCIERFKRLGNIAYNNGIYLAIENLSDNDSTRIIISAVDNPNVGLCFDTGHNNIAAHDDFSLLSEFKDKIFALHAHDNDSMEDYHLLPYEGNVNWDKFKAVIDNTSYSKSFMLEACNPYKVKDLENEEEFFKFEQTDEHVSSYLKDAYEKCTKILSL